MAPIFANFEGERAPQKTRDFFVKIFQTCFFQKFACGAQISTKTPSF